jgi:hypothetical protein
MGLNGKMTSSSFATSFRRLFGSFQKGFAKHAVGYPYRDPKG